MCQAPKNPRRFWVGWRQTHPEYVARQRWEKNGKGGVSKSPFRRRFVGVSLWDEEDTRIFSAPKVDGWLLLGLEKSDLFAVDLQAILKKFHNFKK